MIKGYRGIAIPLTSADCCHYLFIKEHQKRSEALSTGKVLFVGNVDYVCAMSYEDIDKYLRLIFERFGNIESVSVSSADIVPGKVNFTRFAHIAFTKRSSLRAALASSEEEYKFAADEVRQEFSSVFEVIDSKKSLRELRAIVGDYIQTDHNRLQAEIDAYMADFDSNELAARLEKERQLSQPDNDGFMPVKSRFGLAQFFNCTFYAQHFSETYLSPTHFFYFCICFIRNKRKRTHEGVDVGGRASVVSLDDESKAQKKHRNRSAKKQTELKNFYRFQMREERIAKLDSLRKKFEEDKAKVARMKEARKFKPF